MKTLSLETKDKLIAALIKFANENSPRVKFTNEIQACAFLNIKPTYNESEDSTTDTETPKTEVANPFANKKEDETNPVNT